jgi:hypothetical protein
MLLHLLACPNDGPAADGPAYDVDARLDPSEFAAVPEGGQQWLGPDVVVPAQSEVQYCLFDTYDGPDVGIHSFESFQADIGHHLILLGTSAGTVDYADGEVVDCTQTNQMMTSFEPLINAEPTGQGSSYIELPEGMAVKLDQGQRIVVQAHYLNTTTEDMRVQDVMNIGFVAEDAIETPAAAFALTQTDLDIPSGESSVSFDCSFPDDAYTVLYLTGHMHEWGKSFSFAKDGAEIYTIPEWDVSYRDAPPLDKYEDGSFFFEQASTLTTTCTWYNDTDEAMTFPEEMCATYGMLYPSDSPVVCSD